MGMILIKNGRGFKIFAHDIVTEPPFKKSCIRHCEQCVYAALYTFSLPKTSQNLIKMPKVMVS